MTLDAEPHMRPLTGGEHNDGGLGRTSMTGLGDAGDGDKAVLIAEEEPDRGLLDADSLLYDGAGKRRNMRFWRRS